MFVRGGVRGLSGLEILSDSLPLSSMHGYPTTKIRADFSSKKNIYPPPCSMGGYFHF